MVTNLADGLSFVEIKVHRPTLELGRFRFFKSVIGYFFQVGRFSVFIKISVSVSAFLRSKIYLIFEVISTACARPVGCMYMFTLYNSLSY
jgi:hypothetical protein